MCHQEIYRRAEEKEMLTDSDGNEHESLGDLWLTGKLNEGRGAFVLCLTEGGDIGIFRDGDEKCIASGDSAYEAIEHAAKREGGRDAD